MLYLTGVRDKEFVMVTKAKLGAKAMGRKLLENNESYELRELQSPYNHFGAKIGLLRIRMVKWHAQKGIFCPGMSGI